MAEFRPMVITNKGQALIAKMLAGKGKIEFTKISLSDKEYSDSAILTMGSISGVKQTSKISKVLKTSNAAVQVEGAVTNKELNTGYHIRTIALHAKDPDDGEIVYAACGASTPGWMPAFSGVSTSGCYLKLVTTVQNAENVTVTVDPAAVATIKDINRVQADVDDIKAHLGYTDDDIYGVEVDYENKRFVRLAGAKNKTPGDAFDSINAFGGRKRCNLSDEGVVNAYYGDSAYAENGSNGQVMVEQPKFWYKIVPLKMDKIDEGIGYHLRKARYYVSDYPKAGFKVHPAFIKDGKEVDKIYLSAYEGCLYDVSESRYIINDERIRAAEDKLSSIVNAKPTSTLTRSKFRTNAEARGTGWNLASVQSVALTQLLFLVEYGTLNMQNALGRGVIGKASGEGNESEITGATTNLGNKSGSVENENGHNVITYRGEENIYGNIWKFIDGMNIYPNNVHHAYIADHALEDDKFDGHYKNVGFKLPLENGYISAFGYSKDFDWLFLTSEVKGNSSVPVGDYFYQDGDWEGKGLVALLGGGWDCGGHAGGFCWGLAGSASIAVRGIGSRLLYVPVGK